jgi:seryl-tRNA synthetase
MLDIRKIREDPEGVEAALRKRDPEISLAPILELEAGRRDLIVKADELKNRQNTVSKEIGKRKASGEDASELLAGMGQVKKEIAALDQELRGVEAKLQELVEDLPNIPHPSVPVSTNKEDNVTVRTWGEPARLDFEPRNHLEIAQRLGILDFEAGARIAGSQFPLYRGQGALLEMALISFFLEENTSKGYIPIFPPFLVNKDCMYVSGVLSKFERQYYECRDDPYFLVTTSEVCLANLHRGQILDETDLPLRYTAFTACFRREAGTYGRDERGLIRVHQFNKVEMFKYTTPETSYDELEGLVEDAEGLCRQLGIHHRTTLLVTGDIAQQSAKTYDVEAWLPGQKAFYEVSSCSNCEDYQARRGNVRYRPASEGKKAKPRLVHMLNGSGLATSRLMVAILESNQQADGSVTIPEVLRKFMGGRERITPE